MAVDIGTKKHGLAVSCSKLIFAYPLCIVNSFEDIFANFTKQECKTLVVGYPFPLIAEGGGVGEHPEIAVCKKVDDFVKLFKKHFSQHSSQKTSANKITDYNYNEPLKSSPTHRICNAEGVGDETPEDNCGSELNNKTTHEPANENINIIFVDENFSSANVEAQLGKKSKNIDASTASTLLRQVLDVAFG